MPARSAYRPTRESLSTSIGRRGRFVLQALNRLTSLKGLQCEPLGMVAACADKRICGGMAYRPCRDDGPVARGALDLPGSRLLPQ